MSQQEDKNTYGLAPTRLARPLPYRTFCVVVGTEVYDRLEGIGLTPEAVVRHVEGEFADNLRDALKVEDRSREDICASWPDYVVWEGQRAIVALIPRRSGKLNVVRLDEYG